MRSSVSLIAIAALLTACSGDKSASSSSASGGTVILALSGDAISIYPPSIIDLTGRLVQDQVFDRLAEIGQDLNTIGDKGFSPRLAQRWTWARDSMSIAFSIDPRARWHDGKPVTASDVRFSLNAFKDPKFESPVAALVTNIDSVHVQDSLTAVFWFKKHTPEQFYDAAYQVIVMPEHVYGGIPADQMRTSPVARNPIGSGRFRFVRWEPSVQMELIADTSNYRGRSKLDRIVITPTPEASAGATKLMAGTADLMDNFPLPRAGELDTSSVARKMVWANFGGVFLALNPNARKSKSAPHPIFSDRQTRRALSMAVDRVSMLKNVFGADGRLSHGPFSASSPYADTTLHPLAYDTTAAKAAFDSAGWRVGPNGIRAKSGRPLRFSITVPPSPTRTQYAQLLQAELKKVGVQVDIDAVDPKTLAERQNSQDYDALMASFVADPSASSLRQNWGTEGIGPDGQNFLKYSNKKFDALLDTATQSFDPATRRRYTSRAFQTILDDAPAIFLYDLFVLQGLNRRIVTAPMRTDEWWANLADWTIAPGKQIDRDKIGLKPAKP
jgi:peptide/nickel transport system substrate-binding protein